MSITGETSNQVSPQSFFNDTETTLMITPSEVIEHVYCPRFTYFMNCLNIPQHEELRYKVRKGRELHSKKEIHNKTYLRKKIGCVKKEIGVYLASPLLHVRGIVDEVLHFADGSVSPLDYKLTEYRDFLFRTHKIQSTLYAMLISEIYRTEVRRGFVCYMKKGSRLEEIEYRKHDFKNTEKLLSEIFSVIERGFFPKKSSRSSRCADCCYKNICV